MTGPGLDLVCQRVRSCLWVQRVCCERGPRAVYREPYDVLSEYRQCSIELNTVACVEYSLVNRGMTSECAEYCPAVISYPLRLYSSLAAPTPYLYSQLVSDQELECCFLCRTQSTMVPACACAAPIHITGSEHGIYSSSGRKLI